MKRVYLLMVLMLLSLRALCDIPPGVNCNQGDQKDKKQNHEQQDDHPADSTDVDVYTSVDPNEIIGTKGYDALGDTLQWVAATASLPYTIYFENDPELATAAAQKVEVRHRLHAKADISTFAIGAFGFGSHVFTAEGNRSSYQQRLDLTQDMGIYVDVVAGIDIVAGEAFWILQSIDPATGLPPQGTQQGFLPVNDENHSGEGYVSFTIKPKANACITGDELTASASIVFDINEAIPTNVWHNTVDALPPTTQLTGTDNGNNEVLLQFSGQDDEGGCGIKQYKLYVSDNYGVYSLYDTYPIGTTATYLTEYDHCYRFFCLGEDNVGNVEAMKEEAEVVIEDNANVTQTIQLAQGWNWWSTYIEQENNDGLSMLENSLGESGVGIVSQAVGYTYYYPDYGWYGSLAAINNESSYKINANEPCTAVITGQEADPSQHPITLGYGWTWIGYVPSVAMDVNEALSGLEAVAGDMLKSQEGYSEFYADYGWYGSLSTIESGMGLMYYSSNGDPVTFTYPNNGRGGEMKANLTSKHNHWKPNVYAYPDNMTVMAVVELGDTELSSDNYELAAFATNGECRGSVRLIFAEPLHRHVAFLTVSGEDAAELSFRLYDAETGMEYYDAEESLSFVANAIVGEADDLYTIHFRGTMGADELANRVQVYPNPVNRGKRFSINVAEDVNSPVRVEIINALGVETLRATSVQTPATLTAPAVAGIYTLRITVEGRGTIIRKLVVK